MTYDLEKKINDIYQTPSDINEHILTIVKYGSECKHITEMGVRGIVSTWGWLAAMPEKLIGYDLYPPSRYGGDLQSVYDTAAHVGVNFQFIQGDTLEITIEPTDLLFIDTWHVYDQLKQELTRHHSNVNRYICLHDTTSYEFENEGFNSDHSFGGELTKQGLWPAVEEFLHEQSGTWILRERYTNNNGFTILERVQ